MSLSGGAAGGKAVDSNAVDPYDSGDEWDIGVGNLIIDLDADLEKDKLEMSGTKEGGAMGAPPSAVAALPENIKFVSPVPTPQGKESKAKSKRSKNSKEAGKALAADGAKKEAHGRAQVEGAGAAMSSAPMGTSATSASGKGNEKGGKASRNVPGAKKDKEGCSTKNKKEKSEGAAVTAIALEKEGGAPALTLGVVRGAPFEGPPCTDSAATELLGNVAAESPGMIPSLTIKTEPEDPEGGECRATKKVKSEKIESPVSTPALPPLQLLAPVALGDIASPCEQIMVRTRSAAVNTADVGLATEPECLGPCEPGTSVNLEGIVWQETEDGMLVVNVTWRNKTYVGTLLDCTRHDWAPPRFCESPTSDVEMRNGRGRGKRIRPNSNTPVQENSNSSDNKGSGSSKTRAGSNSKGRRGSQTSSERRTPPNSNAEDIKASPSSGSKRKTKPASDMEPNSSSEDTKGSKRMRTNSSSGSASSAVRPDVLPPPLDRSCPSPVLIDCPHPNCNKKYKHINGLRYHQARAHNDDDVKLDLDGDSECGEDSALQPEGSSCNGASISQRGCLSPACSFAPKGRGFDAHSPSPSPGKLVSKQPGKKRPADGDLETAGSADACEEGPCLTDEASNDGTDDRKASDKEKSRKAGGAKSEKSSHKSVKCVRPGPPTSTSQQLYPMSTASFSAGPQGPALSTVVQSVPKSPQLKGIQPKPVAMGDPSAVSPSLSSSKDKKKKEKKKKEAGKDAESPRPPGKGAKPEEGKSPYSECSDSGAKSDGLLNGSSDPHQSRLASIKAEADKIYSFSDNAPSPSIGVGNRLEGGGGGQPLAPLQGAAQNGADNSSAKTNSPAYSDISDAGEDAEAKVENVKAKTEEQVVREGAKKSLFPSQTPSKESPYYSTYDNYYSPSYTNPSPGASAVAAPLTEGGQPMKVKKEEEQEAKHQQPSVIQQRSSIYMQPLYYNQYAYVPPYGYHSEQAYHSHLMSTNPTYRQQIEERQRHVAEHHRAADKKDRESSTKEEWKQKASIPPTLSKTPSLSDLGKVQPPSKCKESSAEGTKSVIIPKEDSRGQVQQAEGLKMKLSEGAHHIKEEHRSSVDSAMWYRQEQESRLWPYVYPSKYCEAQKQQQQQQEEERWRDEREQERHRERDRDRKGKEDRSRPKEESKESGDPRTSAAEDHRAAGKDPRGTAHMQFSSPLAQHQSYMPYVHGYPYGQGYDPNHPGYRGMPSVMMQNYPGSYLSAGYPFSHYGSKVGGAEEGDKSRGSPTVSGKAASEAKALDILHQHASQYKSKSPSEKGGHERERLDRDRDLDRPRSSPSQRIVPTHHHLGYPLLSGQYDLSYAAGLSSSAIVASQQASAPSLYPPARR
ncbi:zinc finger protein 609-like [Scleropages formosus]|uniref:Zinc finger protein 609-like n=1 Tax=Scleropages formosus TaxID=113540 RepID=A0A0P7Z178_SCLFO|nr:zinc finger protein 609-like [Scleropages formosus]